MSCLPLGPVRRATAVFAPLSCALLALPVLAQSPAASTLAVAPETVVVTASRSAQPLSSVLADVSVIDRSEIERSGATGVADLLARLPGIEFARNGGAGTTTSVFIRGNEARHTAVYLDGVRIDSQSTGGAVWEQLPLDQIERIEVLRGPAAALYGSDAVAGVVQLFTRRGQGAAQPTAALTLGSQGTAQASLGVSGTVQALDYSVSASHGRSDGFDARTPAAVGHNPDDDGWTRSSLQGRVGLQIDPRHRLEASLLASNLKAGYDDYTPGTDDQNRHQLRSASLAWQARWNAAASTRVQLGETRSTSESRPNFYRTETTLRDYTLQHEQRWAGQVFTATLERRSDELFNAATAFGAALSGDRHQDGIGLGWRGDFGDHGLQAHVRHDDDSEFGGKSTGSLAWGWRFLPHWRLTAAAATSFRAPTLYQRFSEYGNPSLVPETGRNLELGLRWAASGSEASLSLWRNKVNHLISFGAPGACLSSYGCYENVGRAQLEGITLAGRTQLGAVALRASLDWHDPRNLDTDTVLARRARRLATLGAETQWAGWTLGSELQAAGQRVEYDFLGNAQRLGGYGLVNLYASTTLMRGLDLEARIDNLGDKDYELARTYATAGRSGQVTLRWRL